MKREVRKGLAWLEANYLDHTRQDCNQLIARVEQIGKAVFGAAPEGSRQGKLLRVIFSGPDRFFLQQIRGGCDTHAHEVLSIDHCTDCLAGSVAT